MLVVQDIFFAMMYDVRYSGAIDIYHFCLLEKFTVVENTKYLHLVVVVIFTSYEKLSH